MYATVINKADLYPQRVHYHHYTPRSVYSSES